ncbi:MAG: tandem-95 repeat protein, partial [Hyphomonas sp.]
MLKKNKAQKRNPSRTPENSDALHPKESSLFPGLNSPEALELSALESRIMLDAAGAVTLAEAAADSMAQLDADGFEQLAQQLHAEHIAATEGRSARDLINDLHATDFSAPIDSPSSLQIVFIDDSVNDPEALLSNIPEGALVFTINGDSDGVEQMTAILDGYENVDAIHILSHGDQGELYLGNDVLNAESIQGEHLDELTRIGQSLSSDGDILIYGCDFTGGEDGLQAAILLGGVTGADIAASIDETGSANLGGDWDLETELGSIETQSISADNWTGLLAPAFVDLDNTDGAPGPSAFDDFETGNLTGGTGWVGNWVITGAGSGDIDVETDGGDSSMAIQDNDVQVARTVNLTGAETATLSFDYRRDSLESNEHLFVYISNSSTGGLVEIGRLSGSADDSSYLNFSADITSYIASDTTITFRTSSNWSGLTDEIFLDNISITSTATPPTGYEAEYTQNGAAIAIAGPNTEITDVDSASQASATITLTNPQAGDALSLISALPAGISGSVNAGGDVVTLTGVASNADYAAALQLVGFSSISGDVTERTINVVVNDGTADSSISVSTITVNPDNDGDGVADRYDIDDDNDGILDINESPTVQVTLDVVTAIPAGAIPGNPNGIRLSDSTGQYVVDIYEGSNTTDDSYTFNTTTGRIESDGAGGIDETEIVELVYTTVNSPTQFNLQTIQILDIDSLSNGPGATGFRDAYAFSELGTWQPLGTGGAASPAGAVVSVDTGNADSVGQFIITDPDGGNNLNDIGSFAQLTSIDATVSDVLLNMTGEIDNHNATFQFESEHETASLYVFNAGAGDIAWGFFPQMTITVPPVDAPDTDGDGVIDQYDLDSDNDGITDNVEAQTTAGYIDPGTFVDVDGDGLNDIYDADTSSTNPNASVGLTPVNTDGRDDADYLDWDSDNDTISDLAEAGHGVTQAAIDASGDADGDGILDVVDGVSGRDVNDDDLTGSNFNLSDSNSDVAADGSDAIPLINDFDYRDADADNDGIAAYDDLDDDNDGVLDTVEFNFTNFDPSSYLNTAGTASIQTDGSVRLSEALGNQAGSVMSDILIDMNYDFTMSFEVYLGTDDNGADGIAFVLHNDPDGDTAVGAPGYGVGAHGIEDGIAIEFDTWQNGGELANDHTSVWDTDTGDFEWAPNHADYLLNPVDLGNIEDGAYHDVTVSWDADTQTLTYTFDGNNVGSITGDLVNDYFGGAEAVHFGWTASTGGAVNEHSVRIDNFSGHLENFDTDGDGLSNHIDIDSDNDGITDNVEAQSTGRYIAPSGMPGAGFTDIDGDGLDDVYDADTGGAANSLGLTPVNTDQLDTPDMYDTDSDNDGTSDADEAGHGVDQATIDASGDTDGDGLNDAVDDVNGWDVNDDDYVAGGFTLADSDNDTSSDGLSAASTQRDFDYRDNIETNNPPTLQIANGGTVTQTDIDAGNVVLGDNLVFNGGFESGVTGYVSSYDYVGTVTETRAPGDNDPLGMAALNGTTYGLIDNNRVADDLTGFFNNTSAQEGDTFGLFDINDSALPFWETGVNIDDDQQYVFSAFLANINDDNNLIRPDVSFVVVDNLGNTTTLVSTGELQSGGATTAWEEFSAIYNPVDGVTSARIQLISNVSGFVGNDLALDNVQMRSVSLDADADGVADNVDFETTFTEGDAPVALTSTPDVSVSDLGDQDIVSFDVDISSISTDGASETISFAGQTLVYGTPSSGTITQGATDFDYSYDGNGSLSFTNNAGAAIAMPEGDIATLLTTFTYQNTDEDPTAGDRTVTYQVTDDGGAVSSLGVSTITVVPVNDAPTASAGAVSTAINTPVSGAVSIADVDSTPTASLSSGPSAGSVTVNPNGTYTYTPNFLFVGVDSFDVLVDDGDGASVTVTVNVSVGILNQPPVADDDAQTTDEDVAVSGAVTLSDPNGDTVTASLGSAPTNGTATVNPDGTYTYTPDADFFGTDTFEVLADDGNGATDTATVTITVNPINDNPVAADDSQTTDEDVAVNGAVTLSDVDGDTVTASLGSAPANGTATVNPDGTYTYTPNADFNGTDTFTISADDGNGGTDVATISITVNPVNDAPTGTAAPATTNEDTAVSGAIVTNDVDGDSVTATLTTPPANGTAVVLSNGTYTYTPAPDFNGTDSFVVQLNDSNGGLTDVTVTVTVDPIQDAPVAADDAQTTDEDIAVNGAVALSDVDGDTVTASLGSAPLNGTAVVNTDGTYTYTPNAD